MNITLGSSELCGIFDFDEDNEEKVVPHVVLSADVVVKGHVLVLEGLPLQPANETGVLKGLLLVLLLRPAHSRR